MKSYKYFVVILVLMAALLLLSACSLNLLEMGGVGGNSSENNEGNNEGNNNEDIEEPDEPEPPPPTDIPTETPTETPVPTATFTPEPTATFTPEPTPTEEACSHVNLSGRYVDFRTWRGAIYGWIMLSEQHGCDFVGMESFFLKAQGPGSQSDSVEITGTINGDKMRICYTTSGYCLNLAILENGDVLANGVEGWYYERTDE